ncbi:hypothetical protein KGY73_11430 [bacterium]|nr:hypothetical protein [bacterium]
MCQYCGNTGLCYFIIAYGGPWIFRKLSGIYKRTARNRMHKKNEQLSSEQLDKILPGSSHQTHFSSENNES